MSTPPPHPRPLPRQRPSNSPKPSTTSSAASTPRSTPRTTPSHTPTSTPSASPHPTPPPPHPTIPPPPGLFNLGNTCYLNSVLQVLYHTPSFRQKILSTPPSTSPSFATQLQTALRAVFLQLSAAESALKSHTPSPPPSPSNTPLSPSSSLVPLLQDGLHYVQPRILIDLLRDPTTCTEFDARGQQDAHELLRFLLDKLNDAISHPPSLPRLVSPQPPSTQPQPTSSKKRPRPAPPSPPPAKRPRPTLVPHLFGGRAVTTTRCSECETLSTRSESFLDVSLPVEAGRSLEWAMSTQCAAEQLRHTDKYFCEFCATYTEASRWWQVSVLPRVFTVHLKLFAYGARLLGAPGGKVSVAMPCPMRLALAEWCTTDCPQRADQFRLTAVIVHEGTGASSGHYYSYVCNVEQEQQWFCCDDSFVTHVSEEEVKERLFTSMKTRRTAYLLFYTNLDQLHVRSA